jgi:glutamine synthetase
MGRTQILPAALRYQGEVAAAVNATKAAGADAGAQADLLKKLVESVTAFQKALGKLDHALSHHAEGDPYTHAKYARDAVLPAMAELRNLGDGLEAVVADDLWPLPTYREMLFIK